MLPVLILLLGSSLSPVVQVPDDAYLQETEKLSQQVLRLPPMAYPQLPREVVRDLEERGCSIPQTGYEAAPHNVVHGEFVRMGQVDCAVLCSRKKPVSSLRTIVEENEKALFRELWVSTMLVYFGGDVENVAGIAEFLDMRMMIGPEYTRILKTVGRKYIEERNRMNEGPGIPPVPPIDHEGIDDATLEKASIVHYFHDGKWLQLAGAD